MGIIGGGMIGSGWARLLARHGHEVRVFDRDPVRCRGAATLPEAVAGADLVIEAVVEEAAAKRTVLAAAAAAAPPGALLASSSSSLLPSALQEGLSDPGRVLVLHPLHPVELLPVVEVVPGPLTRPEAVDRARQLLLDLGKSPVVLTKEIPGYVVNRLAAAVWREAINLVLEGVADPTTLDLAAARGPCLGWAVQGPFLTYELAAPGGLGEFMAHLHPAFSDIWESLAKWTGLSAQQLDQLAKTTAAAYGKRDRSLLEAERDEALVKAATLLPPPN